MHGYTPTDTRKQLLWYFRFPGALQWVGPAVLFNNRQMSRLLEVSSPFKGTLYWPCWQNFFWEYAYSLWIKIYIEGKVQHWSCWQNCFYEYAYSLWIKIYTLKGRYNIGHVGKTASTSRLTLFESRYTLKGRYNIGNVGKTASTSMLALFESRYTLKGRYSIGNVGKTASMSMLTLFESRYKQVTFEIFSLLSCVVNEKKGKNTFRLFVFLPFVFQ